MVDRHDRLIHRFRRIVACMALWGLALALLSGAGFVAWCIYVGVSDSIHAEAAPHATNEACELVTEATSPKSRLLAAVMAGP